MKRERSSWNVDRIRFSIRLAMHAAHAHDAWIIHFTPLDGPDACISSKLFVCGETACQAIYRMMKISLDVCSRSSAAIITTFET